MHRAFSSDLCLDSIIAHRFTRVLRLKAKEPVELFNGQGKVLRGLFVPGHPPSLIETQVLQMPPEYPYITLYQALVPMEKLESIVQQTTELGVSKIILFKAERSQVDFKNKIDSKLERLTRIAQDASRQSGRAWVPRVGFSPSPLVGEGRGEGFIADPTAPSPLIPLPQGEREINIIIGPEGGFSAQELDKFKSLGAKSVRLAPYTLRTETAGLAAIAQIQGVHLSACVQLSNMLG